MKILVGSKNPVKINSVEEAFKNYYDDLSVSGIDVESGVAHQPFGNETFTGAENRAIALKRVNDENGMNA